MDSVTLARTELISVFYQCNHPQQRVPLSGNIVGSTYSCTDVQFADHLSGRTGETAERFENRNECGGDSGVLETPRDQTHGLMANRSRRDEQHRVDVVRV